MQFIEEHVEEFFSTARERYEILLRRKKKRKSPWSEDPIFQKWRFCNVNREDDTVTKWIEKNVRTPMQDDPRVLTAMTACRCFNRITTLKILHRAGLLKQWDGRAARELLRNVHPVTGAAYLVKTPRGFKKADGVCWLVDRVDDLTNQIISDIAPGTTSLEDVWNALVGFKYFGPFMAYEITTDIRHTKYLRDAPDIHTWACPGIGACRGLSWIMARNLKIVRDYSYLHRKKAMRHMLVLQNIAHTMPAAWPSEWPKWEMRTVEHWLAEYAKYIKVKYLGCRLKRTF